VDFVWRLDEAACTLIGLTISDFLSVLRERRARYIAASKGFHAAVKDAMLNLTAYDTLTSEIARSEHARHLNAIYDFSPYIPKRRRRAFSEAVDHYDKCARRNQQMGAIGLFASDNTHEGQLRRRFD
jgi:hypothetical protein